MPTGVCPLAEPKSQDSEETRDFHAGSHSLDLNNYMCIMHQPLATSQDTHFSSDLITKNLFCSKDNALFLMKGLIHILDVSVWVASHTWISTDRSPDDGLFFFFLTTFQSPVSFCPMPHLAFVPHLSLSPVVRTLLWGMAADGNPLGGRQ